jgi:exodeoxyribonuclease VII large subunit
MLTSRAQELWMLSNRGRDIVDRRVESERRRTSELGAGLRALSPLATLARGYAIAQLPDGAVLRDAADAPAGTTLRLTLEQGTLAARSDGAVADVVPHGTTPPPPTDPLDDEARDGGVPTDAA